MSPAAVTLAAHLERLLQLPLATPSDVEAWTDASCEVESWLAAHVRELSFKMPPQLMFYFHDPDIRVKDPDYKASQEQSVRHLIRQLRGEVPLDIRRPWWRFW